MDDTTQVAPAQPTETPTPAPALKTPMDMTSVERDQWRKDGTRPPLEPSPAPEAESDEPLAPTVAAPIGTPAAPAPPKHISKRQQQINDYERTVAELKAENARLKAFETMRPSAAPRSEPPTAPAQPTTPAELMAKPNLSAPPLTEAQFFAQFPDAPYADYPRYLTRYDVAIDKAQDQQRTQHEAASRAFEAQKTTFVSRVAAVPAFNLAASPSAQQCYPGTPMGDVIFESEHPVELFQHFDAHPTELQRIGALPPVLQIREMARLDAKFDQPAAVPASTVPTSTRAPDPPVMLGSRPTDPVDPATSALKRRDTAAYFREMNARDLAASRR